LSAQTLAALQGLTIVGPDRPVRGFGLLSSLGPGALGYMASEEWLGECAKVDGAIVLTTADLARQAPASNTYLVTDRDPKDAFHLILRTAVEDGWFSRLAAARSRTARIAPSAIIADNVHICDGAEIGPHAVVYPNTYVGPHVVIKANATIGGTGFEIGGSSGSRFIVPHAGGVWLSRGVHVGSSTCIDRGLFGDFTFLGEGTLVDNLVHIAHSVRTGHDCSIVACSEISGSAVLGDGVWIGPNSALNPRVHLGDHAYLGTASTVTRDVPAYALAYGSPAKVRARVCSCKRKLDFRDGRAACVCGHRYVASMEGAVRRE
jgi:UDP-3-O-[3-hydroxymyristoyl] glucosamine N-acyltransferase